MATARGSQLDVRPLTAARVDDVKTVTQGTWGSACWDLFPRYSAAEKRSLGIAGGPPGAAEAKRRALLAKLARRRKNSAGLVAYRHGEPIGFISLGPRYDFSRIENSKATPPVDDGVDAWVIPCITVRRGYRGTGVGLAMIRAAVEYAGLRGAPAVEAYPRADATRVHDDLAFFGTKVMFEKAGFEQIRGVLPGLPKGWAPRVTMRRTIRKRVGRVGRSGAAAGSARGPRAGGGRAPRSRGKRPSSAARRTASGGASRARAR